MADSSLIPLWIDWSDKVVLVVGLGSVGQRRATMFQKAGATVIGVDPLPKNQGTLWGELIRHGLELRSEPYQPELFDELNQINSIPDLVLACASQEVNQRVIVDSRKRRLWVASATLTNLEQPDVHLGAFSSGDHASIAVQSGNAAPALSVLLRDIFADKFLAAADRLAAVAVQWRAAILSQTNNIQQRRELLELFGNRSILELETQYPGQGVAQIESIIHQALDLKRSESKLIED